MGLAVTVVLGLFWLVMAWRSFQRGDLLVAGVLLAVGVVLTIYRMRLLGRQASATDPQPPPAP